MKSAITQILRSRLLCHATLLAAAVLGSAGVAYGQVNNLQDPGAESDNFVGWTLYGNTTASPVNFVINTGPGSGGAPIWDGTYTFKVFGNYNAGTGNITSGMTQSFAASAGDSLTAGGEAYSLSTDYVGQGANLGWVEVDYFDGSASLLAVYRSAQIGADFPSNLWQAIPVTNQWNTAGTAIIGTVPSGNLVAPAGTASVEFSENFQMVNYNGGSIYWDDFYLDSATALGQLTPPYITNAAPSTVLNNSNTFSFNAVSASSTITNVQVTVVSSAFPGGSPSTNTYGITSTNLTITGLGTANVSVDLPITSNTVYTVTPKATDSGGLSGTETVNFDTIQPVFFWEASDFNYNSGQYAPGNEEVLQYANQVGTEGIDEHKNGGFASGQPHFYRPEDPVSIQAAAPSDGFQDAFVQYDEANPGANTNENTVEEEVGYVSPQDWVNYTRDFPKGSYNVYARYAETGANGVSASLQLVTSDPTQPSQTTTTLGTFSTVDNGWNTYVDVPLEDSFGNPVAVALNGVETLRVTTIGNYNADAYFLIPAVAPKTPSLLGSYPDGLNPFELTNHFSFTVGPAAGSPIASSNIDVKLNGVDVTSQAGLTAFEGTNWTGSVAISTNGVYTALITVTNNTRLGAAFTINFDTFSQSNYMWECVDWDFNGGQYIDNPVPSGDNTLVEGAVPEYATGETETNSYYLYPEGNSGNAEVPAIDVNFVPNTSQDQYYRPLEPVGTELNSDLVRQKFLAARIEFGDPAIAPFDLGWQSAGDWLNYTRHYPVGTYNIYARLAGGGGPFSNSFLSVVTSGATTSTQTTNVLGYFADPNAAGWQVWHWIPMLTSDGQLKTFSFNGGTNTLKWTSGGGENSEFFMLVPTSYTEPTPVQLSAVVNGSHGVTLSFSTQSGYSYTVVYKDSLSASGWSTNSVISGNGSVQTVNDTPGTDRFYEVFAH